MAAGFDITEKGSSVLDGLLEDVFRTSHPGESYINFANHIQEISQGKLGI